jgi:hypothetical protein
MAISTFFSPRNVPYLGGFFPPKILSRSRSFVDRRACYGVFCSWYLSNTVPTSPHSTLYLPQWTFCEGRYLSDTPTRYPLPRIQPCTFLSEPSVKVDTFPTLQHGTNFPAFNPVPSSVNPVWRSIPVGHGTHFPAFNLLRSPVNPDYRWGTHMIVTTLGPAYLPAPWNPLAEREAGRLTKKFHTWVAPIVLACL